jgi:hypothetical protein
MLVWSPSYSVFNSRLGSNGSIIPKTKYIRQELKIVVVFVLAAFSFAQAFPLRMKSDLLDAAKPRARNKGSSNRLEQSRKQIRDGERNSSPIPRAEVRVAPKTLMPLVLQPTHNILITCDDRIGGVATPEIIDPFQPNHICQS